MSRLAVSCWSWALLSATIAVTGCATLKGDQAKLEEGLPSSQCVVELKPVSGKSKVGQVAIGDDATVQQVLHTSGADRKYSRVKLDLYRQLPTGEWHKMPVEYDVGKKRIDPLHDYHVQPGDRLIVSEDASDGLDDMLRDKVGMFGS